MLFDEEKVVDMEDATETQIPKEKPEVSTEDDIVDIDLSATKKKRFRIDGDNNRILYLNTSDFSIISRLKETYPKLTSLASEVQDGDLEIDEGTEDVEFQKLDKASRFIDNIDHKMREYIDYIFDSNVSEVCAPAGTMYDLFNGKFRFEYIIEKLVQLHDSQVRKEYSKMSARLHKHTSKYMG